jgi:hypothetical protein
MDKNDQNVNKWNKAVPIPNNNNNNNNSTSTKEMTTE